MTTVASVIHQTRGRIRITIPAKRGDTAFFAALAERIARHSGVLHARGNPAAASLVVEHTNDAEDVVLALGNAELDITPLPLKQRNEGANGTPLMGNNWTQRPWEWGMTPMSVAGAALGVVGIIQALRGEIMIPAMSAFWYAASAFRLAKIAPPARIAPTGTEGVSGDGKDDERRAGMPTKHRSAILP